MTVFASSLRSHKLSLNLHREIDFYPRLKDLLTEELRPELAVGWTVAAVSNQDNAATLPRMIEALHRDLPAGALFPSHDLPDIRPDIVVAVCSPEGRVRLAMVEVKYADQLRLLDFSQLAGYLLASGVCSVGLLALVAKPGSRDVISADFRTPLMLGRIPSKWSASLPSGHQVGSFTHGVLAYREGGRLEWLRDWPGAISNAKDFAQVLAYSR